LDILYIIKYPNLYNNLTINTNEAKYNISICLTEHRKRRRRGKRKELREREKEKENRRIKEKKEEREKRRVKYGKKFIAFFLVIISAYNINNEQN